MNCRKHIYCVYLTMYLHYHKKIKWGTLRKGTLWLTKREITQLNVKIEKEKGNSQYHGHSCIRQAGGDYYWLDTEYVDSESEPCTGHHYLAQAGKSL